MAGATGAMVLLAVVVTLGLLAYAPLGLALAPLGVTAALATAGVGGLVLHPLMHMSPCAMSVLTSAICSLVTVTMSGSVTDCQVELSVLIWMAPPLKRKPNCSLASRLLFSAISRVKL